MPVISSFHSEKFVEQSSCLDYWPVFMNLSKPQNDVLHVKQFPTFIMLYEEILCWKLTVLLSSVERHQLINQYACNTHIGPAE